MAQQHPSAQPDTHALRAELLAITAGDDATMQRLDHLLRAAHAAELDALGMNYAASALRSGSAPTGA